MSYNKVIDREDVAVMQCNRCDKEFETDTDLDENDKPSEFVDVPVECEKGNFCCEVCRLQAMYAAQDEDGKKTLRRYYLGSQLLVENRRSAKAILDEWEVDYSDDDPDSISCALSPEGGVRGVPGPEDDCEAWLLPQAARDVIWQGLFKGRDLARVELSRAEDAYKKHPDAFWEQHLKFAKEDFAKAEAALKALEALERLV